MPRQPTLARRRHPSSPGWTLIETSSEEDVPRLSQRQARLRQEKALTFYRRIALKILYAFRVSAMYENLLRWEMVNLKDQESPTPRTPAPSAARQTRLPRRDDLTYVGRALRPSRSARGFPNLPDHCNHQAYLVAGGGMSRNKVKVYFWTCMGCGNRWERVSADRATNGHGITTAEPTPTQGPLRPRTAPTAVPAASSAVPAPTVADLHAHSLISAPMPRVRTRVRSPSGLSEAPTDVPHHPMTDLSDVEEESEIEIIPTLLPGPSGL